MNTTLDDYNILFIIRVDENIRQNSFKIEKNAITKEDFGDGYYIMMSRDTSTKNVKVLTDLANSDELLYAQPLIGPIPSMDEAETVGNELSYILDSNPGIKLSEALALWDHQFNLSETEERENQRLLN